MKLAVAFATLIVASATARADTVWTRALAGEGADLAKVSYAHALDDGDAHVLEANACMVSPNERRRQVSLALDSYKKAAAALPTEGEPHYRIAQTLDAFYVCSSTQSAFALIDDDCGDGAPRYMCTESTFRTYGPQMVAELRAFEDAAPLDPRLSVFDGVSRVIFTRGLVETKLATPAMLTAAAADYTTILERSDGKVDDAVATNLAEIDMMLGKLDEAIERYEQSLANGGGEAAFGLAVALDRNGQTDRAARTLRSLSDVTISEFRMRIAKGETFFVPFGEVYYYQAMIEEARDHDTTALELWRAYVKSNAHPEFQPRAQAHIAQLLKRLATAPAVPTPRDLDLDF